MRIGFEVEDSRQLEEPLELDYYLAEDDKYSRYFNFNYWSTSKFINGFVSSLLLIIVSELGDKTFFIAAILAMRASRTVVLVASMLALTIMTIFASVMGLAASIIPSTYIHYISISLFVIFGLIMLKEGYEMSEEETGEEMKAVESSIEAKNSKHSAIGSSPPDVVSTNLLKKVRTKLAKFYSILFIQTFIMIFLAEWGDRSQVSTLVLAARENIVAVTLGALLGHLICTGLAVAGGRLLAQRISVRTGELMNSLDELREKERE